MRILTSPNTDGSAVEDVDPCYGVDATTSMGWIETTARPLRKHQNSADSWLRSIPSSTAVEHNVHWRPCVDARRQDGGYSGRQGRHASFISCTDPDDMSTEESSTSGTDAKRDTSTDANRESGHWGRGRCATESDVTQRCVHFTRSTRNCDNRETIGTDLRSAKETRSMNFRSVRDTSHWRA